MSLLGLDVGTTGCKAAAYAADGTRLASAYREYATRRPREGWAELDSAEVWERVQEALAEVAAGTRRDPVRALCVSAMGEAATPVSRDGRILGPCILSSDVRGAAHVEALAERLGPDALFAINPNIPGAQYTLPKLLWLREHQPELWASADRFLLWSELVGFLLGGEAVTSPSQANRTLLLDVGACAWSEKLLAEVGVDRARLPAVAPSGTVAGTVSPGMAHRLGLPEGVRIVVGGHDQACNALGAGVDGPGRAVCGIGTFECITPSYDRFPDLRAMRRAGLNVEHHVLPGLYLSFIYNQGGTLVRWFRDTFAQGEQARLAPGEDLYDLLSRELPEGPTGLFTLPYFELAGPPDFVADASGAVVGLKVSTTRGEILKSIMESVTYYLAEGVAAAAAVGVSVREFVATGGGARSDPWLQIKADVFGVPFVRLRTTECGVLGAAMLAGLATGAWASPREAVAACVARERTFEPDPARHALYQERRALYRELFPLLHPFLARNEAAKARRS